MRKLSDVILETNNVLRSQANERNTISSNNERIISPSDLKNNTKINKKNKKINLRAKSQVEMSLTEAQAINAKFFGKAINATLTKGETLVLAVVIKHVDDGHYKRHGQLRRTFATWWKEVDDRKGHKAMKQVKQTKAVCPAHDGRLWLDISQEEIGRRTGLSREWANKSARKLIKKEILEGKKYSRQVKGMRRDNTVALTLTKDYYKLLNRRWFSEKNRKISRGDSQSVRDINLKEGLNNINQGAWNSVEFAPKSFFEKIQVSVFALCAYGNEVEERKGERYDAKAMYCDLGYYLGWKMACPFLTKKISKQLGALRKQYFPTRGGWQSFLRVVNSTWYFIRDVFVLTLDWLLSFHAVRRILSGDFGIRKNLQNEYFVEAGLEKIKRVDAELRRQKLAKLEKECKTCQTRKKSRSFRSETPNYNNGSPSYATKLTRC